MEVLLTRIQGILCSEDVEGLLALGAPQDEYSSEAQLVAEALNVYKTKMPSEADIVNILQSVWNKCFGPFSIDEMQKRFPAFKHIATQLL